MESAASGAAGYRKAAAAERLRASLTIDEIGAREAAERAAAEKAERDLRMAGRMHARKAAAR